MSVQENAVFFFPPGWTLAIGSPYLALPLLKSYLEERGYSIKIKDLNKEIAKYYNSYISDLEIDKAITSGINAMNDLYFREENKLNKVAKKYQGQWNLQLGFEYINLNKFSSLDIKKSLSIKSPYVEYYNAILIDWLAKLSPYLVGITIVDINQMIPTFQLVSLLKKNGFDGKVIIGGNVVTRFQEELKKQWVFELIDYIIVYQGEEPISILMDHIFQNERIEKVPSLIWKDRDNSIVHNKNINEKQLFLNDFPPPNFDGLPLNDYWGSKYLPIVHYRGCYFGRCNFCSIPYGWSKSGFGGNNSISKVYKDMVSLYQQYNITKFQFVDEAFPVTSAYALTKLLLKSQFNFEWMIYARLEKNWLDINLWDSLSKSGLRKIHFGLEVINSQNRNILGKNDSSEIIKDILKIANDYGVKIHLFLMFGYPGTNIDDADKTIKFVVNNSDKIDTIDINPYILYKHTTVNGLTVIKNSIEDFANEFEYIRNEDKLTNDDISSMTLEYENTIYQIKPNLLHPIYRLKTPWLDN